MILYTDGSASPNPGPGGWAAYCVETEQIWSGGSQYTTNNEMEMAAVLNGLAGLPDGSDVLIFTDSKLVVGWLCLNYKVKANKRIGELRQAIFILKDAKRLTVNFQLIKGHSGNQWNELVDRKAAEERIEFAAMPVVEKRAPCLHLTLQVRNLTLEDWPMIKRGMENIGGEISGLVEQYDADLNIVNSITI